MSKFKKRIQEFSQQQVHEFVPSNLEETIGYLKRLFPLKSPKIDMSDREIWIEVGRQEIIEFLQRTLDKEN
tara:strand:+ start:731 stop:943 length:213 start_codon:yes stop_codon:yes gene_type:complete